MANFSRAIAFVLFAGSLAISVALILHGSEWGTERTTVLQDVRGAMNGAALVLFGLFLLFGKKRRRARNYRSES